MSVINKMLQDLDKRKGRPGGEAVAGDAIRSVKPDSPWRVSRSTLIVIFGLMLASPAVGWWLHQRNGGSEGGQAVVSAPPAAADSVAVAKSPSPAASQVPSAAPDADMAVAEGTPPVQAAAHQMSVRTEPFPIALSLSKGEPVTTGSRLRQAQPERELSARGEKLSASESSLMASANASITPSPIASANAPITPSRMTSVPGPITPDKVETQSPRNAAASPKAAGGKTYSPEQVSANLFAEAIKLDQQGHQEEAKVPLQGLLAANPLHVRARQLLAQLQLDTGHVEEARSLLAEGQRLLPEQSNFTLLLARLQVESGDIVEAIQLLEADRSSARNDPQFHAFLAALLLRVERHDEAMQHYLVALRSDPSNASWLVGVGVAMEGAGKQVDAAEAYRRAEASANLTPEIANFLSERLAQLRH